MLPDDYKDNNILNNFKNKITIWKPENCLVDSGKFSLVV